MSGYSAVKWNGISSLVNQAVTVFLGIFLMRLLSAKDFGLLGMVTVLTGFLHILKDAGLGSSLIYKKNLKHVDLNTVFWFNVLFGALLCLVVFGLSYPLSVYYEEPRLRDIVKVLSLVFVISSITVVHTSILTKQLEFKKKFLADFASTVVSGLVAIVMAFNNYGVWSLVMMNLVRTIVNTIVLLYVSPFFPRFIFSLPALKTHFDYSLSVFGTKSFNYWTRNADNFFIGKSLGSEALGFYSRSFFFVTFPVQKFTSVLGGVLFPVMSQKHYKTEDIQALLIRSIRLVALITFPLIGLLFVTAEPFVFLTFGVKWLPMIPSLKILLVLAMLESVLVLTTPAYYALGATKLNFKLSAIQGIINIICFYIGSQYSIEWVAWLLLVSTSLIAIPRIYFLVKLTNSSVSSFTNSVNKTLLITLIAIGVSILSSNWLSEPKQWQLVTFCILIYATVYLTAGYFLIKRDFVELKNAMFSLIRN